MFTDFSCGKFLMQQNPSPWTGTGGNHLVPGPEYKMDAKEPPNQTHGASGVSRLMSVAWRCSGETQFLSYILVKASRF